MSYSRRDFFKTGTLGGAAFLSSQRLTALSEERQTGNTSKALPLPSPSSPLALDLSPARWVWYPSQRTLPNTFILFRRMLPIEEGLQSAQGWILGDSRYLLELNGQRVQWGPPPADPRYTEADPIDLTDQLKTGENVLGATVLYYGMGDGTWPVGKPGFIFKLDLVYTSGKKESIVSDGQWQCHLARSWQAGHYKRWYLRALQEEFDAKLYPYGWSTPKFRTGKDWLPVQELRGAANLTALSTNSSDYLYNSSAGATTTQLRQRSIPLILEKDSQAIELVTSHSIQWLRPIREYFEMIPPDAYETADSPIISKVNQSSWSFQPGKEEDGTVLTFRLAEQMVGWPFFTIEAAAGTTVELLVHEAHIPHSEGGPAIMNSHFHSWSRFVCKEGVNTFMPFDYESVKWLQLHIHNTNSKVTVGKVGIKRRLYDFPNAPTIQVDDPKLQQLIDASINTIYNNAHDTIVDGAGRERQQYSGDIGHELHALYSVFGETRLPARYLNTYSQGMTLDGFFLDTWPAYDRLNRLAQRQLGLTPWGPLLDHGIAFNFDCYHHYLYTNDKEALAEVFPRLSRFFHYLKGIKRADGMLPVEDIGIPTVWLDTDAYQQQRHKRCAFNLYAIGMLQGAFAPLCRAFNEQALAQEAEEFGRSLWKSTLATFWDKQEKTFVCNLPWSAEEGQKRYCERSLAHALLFDLCYQGQTERSVALLAKPPKHLGRCYPANANWGLWALAQAGETEAIFHDLHTRWIQMESVEANNSMQEAWKAQADGRSQWSHASIAPLFLTYMDLAGIRPLEAGYKRVQIRPQPGALQQITLTNYTVKGPIEYQLSGGKGNRRLRLNLPPGCTAELLVDQREELPYPRAKADWAGLQKFVLQGGKQYDLPLAFC
ncbi:MAG: alpha-L-rhamnosidase N-terminal domain-containing protein [Saprospiraceae bacterium]|nr:alpha-L-rhamnosidase N-terminal domain-containing protein [Saprospiraceae bacterium]